MSDKLSSSLTRILTVLLATTLLFPQLATPATATIIINEFSSNSSPEWVELYNPDPLSVNLIGWTIKDGAQPPRLLDSLGTVVPHGFVVYETPAGWLNNSGGDAISLFAPDPESTSTPRLIDQVAYGGGSPIHTPQSDKSSGRLPDGGSAWSVNLDWTRGSPNPTPLPTTPPTSTPTLSPPTASPTTSPSRSPTPLPTPIPSSPRNITPSSIFVPDSVALRPTPTFSLDATVTPIQVLASRITRRPALPLLFISSGLLLLGAATLILSRDLVREHRSRHEQTDDEDY